MNEKRLLLHIAVATALVATAQAQIPVPKVKIVTNKGWDMEVVDAKRQVTQVKQAFFRPEVVEHVVSEKANNQYDGMPMKTGDATTTIKWELIDKIDIIPYWKGQILTPEVKDPKGGAVLPDEWKVGILLKEGKMLTGAPEFAAQLQGKTDVGDFALDMAHIRRLTVRGPSQ